MGTIPPHIAITYQPKSVYEPGKRGVPSVRSTCKPMTKPLSPAAQAGLDAYGNQIGGTDAIMGSERRGVVAALRAVADNAPAPHHHEEIAFHSGFWAGIEYIRSIATELEGADG